jgi:hypothetical protein
MGVGGTLAMWTLQFAVVRRYHQRNDERRESNVVSPLRLDTGQAGEREGDG